MKGRKCSKCNENIDLHIGDKISFAHNKTYFSHSELVLLADSKGLLTATSEYIDTKYSVINPNGSSTRDFSKAKRLKINIITPNEFSVLLKKVCPGDWPPLKKRPLKEILRPAARIYPLELTDAQRDALTVALLNYGAKISKQRRKSITAVVCPERQLNCGRAKLFKSWGIPVYSYGKIIRTL